MKNVFTFRFNRLFLLSLLTACFMFFTQSLLADQVYVKVGSPNYRQCPRGYRLVFTPKHWRHGHYVPARSYCAPAYHRYCRDGWRDGRCRRW